MSGLRDLKDDFLYTVCHDLRNPLAVVIGQAQLLNRALKSKGQEEEAKAAELILRNAWRMSQMIDMVTVSARLESGLAVTRRVPVDMCQAVRDAVERQEIACPCRIKFVTPCRQPWIKGDPVWIDRCLDNLLSNALKYSPPESPVDVRLYRSGDRVIVSVQDRGPGISPEETPLLFSKYYRASSSKGTEGLGLGLYISRLIVEAHGGDIWVESMEGSGSVFSFSLPAS